MPTDDSTQPQDDNQTAQDAAGDDEPGQSRESLRAERDAQKAAREAASREAEKFRKELQALKRSMAGQPTADELQKERDEAIRERDEARAGRVKDRQDLAIARAAGKYLDPEFHDLAPDLIDRSLLEIGDDGQILSGLDGAFQALVKKRPKVAIQKKPDGGTPPPRNQSGNGKGVDPIAAAFSGKTSFNT